MSYGWLFENSDDDISGYNHINLEHLPPGDAANLLI